MKLPFDIETQSSKNESLIKVSGSLDEFAAMPAIGAVDKVRIDLGGVTHFNSGGSRIWTDWLQTFDPKTEIVLENCPLCIGKHFSTVSGILTEHTVVQSLFIPYFAEESGEACEVLFHLGIEYKSGGELLPPRVIDSLGNAMQIDVTEVNFFRFLKRLPGQR